MERFIINGGNQLKGVVSVSGSKNVALKTLVAACLTDEEVVVENIPLISDFLIMVDIIRELGGDVKIEDHKAIIKVDKFNKCKISLEKAAEIRTSSMFLAPLLARCGKAAIPNPGGCRIGARPIDRTIDGLKKMGVDTFYDSGDGFFHLKSKNGLIGADYKFDKNTHTGTETLLLTAVLAKGQAILRNVAEEPEVDELIKLLNQMGGKVKRLSKREIVVDGVEKLHGTKFVISPDRNEIVTLAIAAIITKGDVFIKDAKKEFISAFLDKLKHTQGGFEEKENGIRFYFKNNLKSSNVITTHHPGFMTDWQGPWSVLMIKANGVSTIHETIYENRFGYVSELRKMGARIDLFNPRVSNPEKFYNFNLDDDKKEYYHAVRIYGPSNLHNGVVNISDLRAGATLVLAALAAKGESVILGVEHLDRGYENFEKILNGLGADIRRSKI